MRCDFGASSIREPFLVVLMIPRAATLKRWDCGAIELDRRARASVDFNEGMIGNEERE